MNKRIAFITTSMTPYKISLFNVLHERLNGQIKVFFMFSSEPFREWVINEDEINFNYQYLDRISCPLLENRSIFLNRRVIKSIKTYAPDVIINNNYSKPANVAAYIYSRLYHKRFVIMEEYHTRYYKNNIVSKFFRKLMQHGADGFIACHKGAYAYLRGCGISEKKIIVTQETLDMNSYPKLLRLFKSRPEYKELKARYPTDNLIYIGRLVELKNVDILFDALGHYIKTLSNNVTLFIAGSGPLEERYRDSVHEKNLNNYIQFLGYLQKNDLIKYLSISKALVLPSTHEIWGMVVNEAIATGVVPIVSHSVGAAELIIDNLNGFTFHPRRPEELASCIAKAFQKWEEMQSNLKTTAQNISLDRYADAFVDAINMFGK